MLWTPSATPSSVSRISGAGTTLAATRAMGWGCIAVLDLISEKAMEGEAKKEQNLKKIRYRFIREFDCINFYIKNAYEHNKNGGSFRI